MKKTKYKLKQISITFSPCLFLVVELMIVIRNTANLLTQKFCIKIRNYIFFKLVNTESKSKMKQLHGIIFQPFIFTILQISNLFPLLGDKVKALNRTSSDSVIVVDHNINLDQWLLVLLGTDGQMEVMEPVFFFLPHEIT